MALFEGTGVVDFAVFLVDFVIVVVVYDVVEAMLVVTDHIVLSCGQ